MWDCGTPHFGTNPPGGCSEEGCAPEWSGVFVAGW